MDNLIGKFLTLPSSLFTQQDANQLLDLVEANSTDPIVNNLKILLQCRFIFDLGYNGRFLLTKEVTGRLEVFRSYLEWRSFTSGKLSLRDMMTSTFSRYRKGNRLVLMGSWHNLEKFLKLYPSEGLFALHSEWTIDVCECLLCKNYSVAKIYRLFEASLKKYHIVLEFCARKYIPFSSICKAIFIDILECITASKKEHPIVTAAAREYIQKMSNTYGNIYLNRELLTHEECLVHIWKLWKYKKFHACFKATRDYFDIIASRSTKLARVVILPLEFPHLTAPEELFVSNLKRILVQ